MDFGLVAGNLALDFVGTVSERTTRYDDMLGTGADVGDWLKQADVVHNDVRVGQDDLRAARALREALYALVVAASEGRRSPRPTWRRSTTQLPTHRLPCAWTEAAKGDLARIHRRS